MRLIVRYKFKRAGGVASDRMMAFVCMRPWVQSPGLKKFSFKSVLVCCISVLSLLSNRNRRDDSLFTYIVKLYSLFL